MKNRKSYTFNFIVVTGIFLFCTVGCASWHQPSSTPSRLHPPSPLSKRQAARLSYIRKEKDYVRYLMREANMGDPDAQYALGYLYYYGRETLPQDIIRASYWIHEAASQHHPAAKVALEILGRRGIPRVRGRSGVGHIMHLTEPVRRHYR